ncbi:TlpA disulfide reductase family protein [Roseivirga sp. E12]|uniref:TlpA disulfide reductase family protein n=1 Tax=Roseivirga sp. E12 TaxID=2819237 RepID=UPI001ABC04DF|nr:TlpA disulfide reductase family protein [Roseivirga sp. E12]MBO3698184.1 AhpC/TSA family protein [Roseivirga sp. E12]
MKLFLLRFSMSLALLVSIFACTTETKDLSNSFTVSGNITGLDTEFMSYSYRDADGKRVSDSVFVKDNKFTYTGQIDEPTHIIFWPNVESTIKRTGRGYYPAKSSQFAFLASPGDEIVFEGEITDFVNAYPTGTKGNDELAEINKKIFPLMNQSVNMQLEINKLEESDPKRETLQASMAKIDKEVIQVKKDFVTSNPLSQAAAWYLSDMMIRSHVSQDESIAFFKSLDNSLSGYPFYQAVAQRVEGIESTKVGKIMPNFTTNATNDGETFELNSLRGKYVLIDFWGTWCAPCIAEMPKVKAYKEKYADKLVILGVNSGDTMEKILKFTEPKSYDWTQILAASGDQDLVLQLNVAGFPTKFILSPEGEILNRFVGDTEEAFDVLDELLD